MTEFNVDKIRYGLLLITMTFFCLIYLLPVNPGMPNEGLDPSWSQVINYAFVNNFKFGSDIVFTYGPLGSYRFPDYVYAESTYFPAIILSITLSIILGCALATVLRNSSLLTSVAGSGAVFTGLAINGLALWFLIPLLFLKVVVKPRYKLDLILHLLLTAALAFSILVKFSNFPIVFIAVVLADVFMFKNGKKPIFSLALFAFWICIYVMAGQPISSFFAYISGSFSTLSGYSESMSIFGPESMIYAYLVTFGLMFVLLLWHFFTNLRLDLFLVSLLASIILFMAFKQGFVRHDGHAITAFSVMSIVFGLLIVMYSEYLSSKENYAVGIILVSFAVLGSFQVLSFYAKTPTIKLLKDLGVRYQTKLSEIPDMLSDARVESLKRQYEQHNARIREIIDLSNINGSVDIYPWDQSFVIAHDLDYTPRPLFQSYSVYTEKLINSNIDFLQSDRAADNILFSVKEIDGRLPSTMEGKSWLEILSRYDIVDKIGDFLHLKKTEEPRKFNFTDHQKITSQFGETVAVPYNRAFAKIHFTRSLFGTLANIAFKPPIIKIQLNFDDGSAQSARLLPTISENGFILSPNITNIYEFYHFSKYEDNSRKVISFSITKTDECCYQEDIVIEFSKIEMERSKIKISNSKKLARVNFNSELQNNDMSTQYSPYVTPYEGKEVVAAHVGTTFSVNTQTLLGIVTDNILPIRYGFYDNAYTGDNKSNGGCFNIYLDKKLPQNLAYNHCIDPRHIPQDRGELATKLEIDESASKYIFEIKAREGFNNTYGWSYWRF